MSLPPYIDRESVQERLRLIFPEGTPNRGYCVRALSASTVFTMLYIGAVESAGRYVAPRHVYRMSDKQARKTELAARLAYSESASKPRFRPKGRAWYADNTREPIRDETLREGLAGVGAVVARADLPTTSSAPRYALAKDFAALFEPALSGDALLQAIVNWQDAHLTPSALARIRIQRSGAVATSEGVMVTFPNGETRRMASGPSSIVSKAVVEDFATRFLDKPAVIWLSESGSKVVTRDDELATSIGLKIRPDKDLPDIILADLGPAKPLLVFVEVVATNGAISTRRRQALLRLALDAGFSEEQVAFVTAYEGRESRGFRKTVHQLALHSFAWFADEPALIVSLGEGKDGAPRLVRLLDDL